MEKLYGYKEEDVLGLIEYIKTNKGALKKAFEGYAKLKGKTSGTIRNLYYAIVKLSNADQEFCDNYLDGKPLTSNRIEFFSEEEEKTILKEIFILKVEGYSVRSAINKITKGDQKLALRYQNKYRDLMKNKKGLAISVVEDIKKENPDFELVIDTIDNSDKKDFELTRLKSEINFLYERLFLGIKKENELLKRKNKELSLENQKLVEGAIKNSIKKSALEFFKGEDGKNAIN